MNYQRYIASRMGDMSYLRGRLGRLFSVLSDADYDALQKLPGDAEAVLKRYLAGEK